MDKYSLRKAALHATGYVLCVGAAVGSGYLAHQCTPNVKATDSLENKVTANEVMLTLAAGTVGLAAGIIVVAPSIFLLEKSRYFCKESTDVNNANVYVGEKIQ